MSAERDPAPTACLGSPRLSASAIIASVTAGIEVRRLDVLGAPEIAGLSEVLRDCVEGGASVSFMLPLSPQRAAAYWRSIAGAVGRGECIVLAAYDAGGVMLGTVTLVLQLPENQPHRADLAKMLVHRRARRRGVGARLLAAAEAEALRAGRTVLVLDTASTEAERVYARAGWLRVGQIPDYALWPGGGRCATTVFCKQLK